MQKKIQEGDFPEATTNKEIHDEVGLLHDAVIKMGNRLKEKAELESYLANLSDDIDMNTIDLPMNAQDENEFTQERNPKVLNEASILQSVEYNETDLIQDTIQGATQGATQGAIQDTIQDTIQPKNSS